MVFLKALLCFRQAFLLLLLFFINSEAFCDPWLPSKGMWKSCSSLYITDKATSKSLKKESNISYELDLKILYLEREKQAYLNDSNLTDEAKANRVKEKNIQIQSIKNLQDNLSRYYPKLYFFQEIEYGVNEKYSLGMKLMSMKERNFINKGKNFEGAQIFQKIKIYDTNKSIMSIKPSASIYQVPGEDPYISAEMRLLLGRVKKHKLGKTFYCAELSHGILGDSWVVNFDYSIGLETKNNTIIMLQIFNSLAPGLSKPYKKRTIQQISVAKPINIANVKFKNKVTLQAGYFNEYSITSKKNLNRGLLISLWVEI